MTVMVVRLFSCLAVAALLAACAQPQASPEAPPGHCRAEPAQFAVGYNFTDALQAEVLRRSGGRSVRVIRPGMPVTMDFRAERVNIELDAGNRVLRVKCG